MRTRTQALIFFAIAVGLLAALPVASSSTFSQEEVSKLLQGKIVRRPLEQKNGTQVGGTSFIIVNAPLDVTWKALFSFDQYPHIFNRTLGTRVVATKPGHVLIEMKQGATFLGVTYSLDAAYDQDAKEIVCRLVRSRPHDLDEVQGFWKLTPQSDGRTLVAYGAVVSINNALIQYWAGDEIERGVLNAPRDLKNFIEAQAASTPSL